MDKFFRKPLRLAGRWFSLRGGLRRDEGWNFFEATLSVVILTVVFLGLTITLIAFREWMTRAWAIRVMDQYANDVASALHERLTTSHRIGFSPPQNGLGSFWVSVLNYDFSNPYTPFLDSTIYTYSAKPIWGVSCAQGNSGPVRIDPGFPPPGWTGKHKFTFTDFGWQGPYQEMGRTSSFSYPMVRVYFSILYQRPRKVELPKTVVNRTYDLEKRYVISDFLKNYNLKVQ